jgi:hypothetical protein
MILDMLYMLTPLPSRWLHRAAATALVNAPSGSVDLRGWLAEMTSDEFVVGWNAQCECLMSLQGLLLASGTLLCAIPPKCCSYVLATPSLGSKQRPAAMGTSITGW